MIEENQDGSGRLIRDFFEVNDLTLSEKGTTPESGSRVSPYVLMDVHSFETIDNADLFEIVPSVRNTPYSNLYGERVILLALELLKLYDRRRDNNILDVVIQLLDFLEENDSSQEELYQINRLQTEKRRRKLTKQEIQYLVSMKNSGIPLQYQLAANILLDSFQEAQLIYEKLDKSEQEIFDAYPIKNLWVK